MTRRAILQIGTEKTGTTTLQMFLKTNRARLNERGFVYPRFCGDVNQTGLAAFAMDEDRSDPLRESHGIRGSADLEPFREKFREAARFELAGDRTALFCNEHCHSRLTRPEEVARLYSFLRDHFDDIRVSVYLRRQDQLALSLYTTCLKSGGASPDMLPRTNAEDPYFNYDKSLRLWEDRFGTENVTVRLFGRNELIGNSIISDFLATWGLGPEADYLPVADQNGSLRPEAQEFLRQLNPHLGRIANLPPETVHGPLAAQLGRLFAGHGARPARAEARAFYGMFAASNAAVLARHFPNRQTLFTENFDAYPEQADDRSLDLEGFTRVTARLQELWTRDLRRMEAEIEIREAQLRWERGRREEAVQRLRQASIRFSEYPPIFRCLGELLLRAGSIDEATTAARRATDLSPNTGEYHHFLGVLLRQTGDLAGAEEAQRLVLALNPDHSGARSALSEIVAMLANRGQQQSLGNPPRK